MTMTERRDLIRFLRTDSNFPTLGRHSGRHNFPPIYSMRDALIPTQPWSTFRRLQLWRI